MSNMASEWTEYELGELLLYEQPTSYIVKSTDYNDTYKIPVLTAGKSFILGYTNESEGVFDKLPVIIFDDFTTATQYVNFKFKVKSSAMKILHINSELVTPKYIFYRMQTIQFDHSTHKRYWIQQYSKIKISVPPLPEQERIVARIEELFSELDKAVETLKTTNQQLAVYRQAVLKEAFTGKLTHSWRQNNPCLNASTTLQSIKNSNRTVGKFDLIEDISLPQLPSSWEWISIGEISTGAEYGTSSKSKKTGIVPVLRMGNIRNGLFDWNDLVYTNDKAEIEKYMLHNGDVLFNRTNSPELVGKTAVFRGEHLAIYAGYLIRINQVPQINPHYLAFFLNSYIAKSYGNKVKTDGVNQSNINSKKLYSYPFPICSKQEQDKIVLELESRLSCCDQIEKTIEQSLQQAEAMRQSILKKAFEGRL